MRRVTCLAVLAAAALAPAARAQPAVGDDPYDGRHVALDVVVSREKAAVKGIAVRPGVAHAQLAGSSRLRVRLLGGGGELLRGSDPRLGGRSCWITRPTPASS